jgi:NitT/TauT family transport system ATP-binding protein
VEKHPESCLVHFSNISHTYAGRPPRTAIHDINFSVNSGEFVSIIGPSGCGKSTIFRILANLILPTLGFTTIAGVPPADFIRQRRLGWMAQQPALLPWLTVKENVALAQRFHPVASTPAMTPDEALEMVGLSDAANTLPESLSGGMQQRLALARLLSLDVELWLMDEPFAALDELTRTSLIHELDVRWQPLQPTVLWITHNIQEAVLLADRILLISPAPGTLLADIPVILPHPRNPDSPDFQTQVSQLRRQLNGALFHA